MKENILLRTNVLVCLIILVGFLLTAILSYRTNYSISLQNIEQISSLTSEGIYYQMSNTFTKPVNISLTMANDSLLRDFLAEERSHLDDQQYIDTLKEYLLGYQKKYEYDSVFLVSTATGRYYTYNGLDRTLYRENPENDWFYELLDLKADYAMKVDNDEAANNEITVFVNCKIKNDQGTIMGVVGVGLRIDYLQSLLQGYQEEFDVDAYLINDDGEIEISTKYTGYETVNLFELGNYDREIRDDILNWRQGETEQGFWTSGGSGADRSNYLVTRYLPELNWHLVVERDTASLVKKLNRQLAVTIAVICAIIATILYIITKVIRSFNRRIISLTQAVEQEHRTMFEKATEQLFENIYELDITNNRPANLATEEYFASLGAPRGTPYDKCLQIVAEKQIKEDYRHGYVRTFHPENVMKAYRDGKETLSYDFMISNGVEYYWMRITARIVQLESDGAIHMLTYRQNINAEKRQENRMIILAQLDEMTGLLTKTATQRRIEHLLSQESNELYAFFIFDIDNFKDVNDQFGHAFGDGVIRQFTKIIRDNFRKEDVLGRIGGDEFVAFLAVPGEEWTDKKAKSLSRALHYIYTDRGQSWSISASIGVAFAPRSGRSFDELYRNADLALYETKDQGRNGFTIYR